MAQAIPVDAYIRVSRVGGREGDSFISPELQRESIERVCQREGLKVVKWFEELDVSGGDAKRPKWNEAIQRVEQGKSKGIVCWNLSRFSRSLKDALGAIDRIEEAGGKLYSEEGQLDKFSRVMRLAIAEDERDRAKAGFQRAVANAIDRGVYVARRIPFGYVRDPETRKLVKDEERASTVVDLFERRAKGDSWATLSKWAKETHGYTFAKSTLTTMLNNPAYLGHARAGKLVNEKAHEPIVSRLLWDRARAARGQKPVHTGASMKLLLRGLLNCETCGHVLVVGNTRGASKNGKREKLPTYTCRNVHCSGRATVKAEEADAFVTDAILTVLSRAELKTGQEKGDLAKTEKELAEAQHELDVFKGNRKAIVTLGVDAWNDLLAEYVIARDLAEQAVDALREEESNVSYEDIPSLWDEWTTESRREFLQKVISECSVSPANRRKLPIQDRLSLAISVSPIWSAMPQDRITFLPITDDVRFERG